MITAIVAAALAAVPAEAPQAAQEPAAMAPERQDSPARMLIDALASDDEAGLKALVRSAFSPRAAEFEPPADTETRILALARQSGGIDIAEWDAKDGEVFYRGTTRRGGIAVEGMVLVEGGKLVMFDMRRPPHHRGPDAPAWPPAVSSPEEAVAAIANEVDWRAGQERFSGAVLIAHRGKPVLDRAWGLARRSPDVPNGSSTQFGMASTTKMLVTASIGRLIDQGKLSLDTSVAKAVPALVAAPGADSTTIRDLLGHRVSYGDYIDQTRADPRLSSHKRATELLPLLGTEAPKRAPAGRIAYSNSNYIVLAAAVEAASGRSYYDFVRADVLDPLGLADTGYGSASGRPANAAVGWIKDEVSDPLGLGAWHPNDSRIGGYRGSPAGGGYSTARDMQRLIHGIATGKVVRPQTLDAMLADRVKVGSRLGAALGFMWRGKQDISAFGHAGGGGNAGVSTAVYATPDGEWDIVVLSNFSSPSGEMLAGDIIDLLSGLPTAPAPVSVAAAAK